MNAPLSDNFTTVVSALACGARIAIIRDGYDTDYELRTPAPRLEAETLRRLLREGWLESAPNGCSYILSDEGRKAYLRSTDELGDGRLALTASSSSQEKGK